MTVGNVGARMSVLAFTSEVGSGSSTLVFVGHFVTSETTPSVVMPNNALTEQDGSKCTLSALAVRMHILDSWLRMSNTFLLKCS